MPGYISARYGDRRRYLVKALREVSQRIERLVSSVGADTIEARGDRRDDDDEWSVKDLVGFARDSEREDLRAITSMIARDGTPVAERRAQHGAGEHHYRDESIDELLWDFLMLREETLWTLRSAGVEWDHAGRHPFRGPVTVTQWVQEMNERDLEVMWRIQNAHDRARPPGTPPMRGLA